MVPLMQAELVSQRNQELIERGRRARQARALRRPGRRSARHRLGLKLIAAGIRMVNPEDALTQRRARTQSW